MPTNIEFKAHCSDPERVRRTLEEIGARYAGLDEQRDIYYLVPKGRLKLRSGNMEKSLIAYKREDTSGSKQSDVLLHNVPDTTDLEAVLGSALDILVVVDKKRHIYFDQNIKVHVDEVSGLGSFVEVEAIDFDGSRSVQELQKQCNDYQSRLGVKQDEMVSKSYSDLILEKLSEN